MIHPLEIYLPKLQCDEHLEHVHAHQQVHGLLHAKIDRKIDITFRIHKEKKNSRQGKHR